MSATPIEQNARVPELIRQLDDAMTPRDDAGRCRLVKKILEQTFAAGTEFLDPKFLAPNPERYARRLVHRVIVNRHLDVLHDRWHVDFLAAGTTPQGVIDFHPSEATREKVEDLIRRQKLESLSDEEERELSHYLEVEHLMRLAKARARQRLAAG